MKAKEVSQSKEAKELFESPILDLLKCGKVSKWDIVEKLEISERYVREMISTCSMYYPVLALSNKEGYRLAKNINSMNQEEKNKELEEVKHQLNEFNSRIKVLKKRMKPLIAYLKVLEREMSLSNPEENKKE